MLNDSHYQWRRILPFALVMVLLLILVISVVARTNALEYLSNGSGSSSDMLAYTLSSFEGEKSLMVYDPSKGVSSVVPTVVEFNDFSFSADGHLAFSSTWEGDAEIYVLDTHSADGSRKNISQNPAADDYPLAWSLDGHYLAYESYQDADDRLIYVWDGKTAINITPNDLDETAKSYSASWSFDGRLAFTVWLDSSSSAGEDPSEIYLWDGRASTNFSQNPTGEDIKPVWNADGQLAFLSKRNGEYDIFVWDGVSVKDGSPDIDTFANISPELTSYYSFPTWTNDGLLAFEAQDPQDTHVQIYLWNGQKATNVSENPTLHNGGPSWSADGRWAFVTFFSPQQLLYVRDAGNHSLLTVEGQYSSAWSSSGYLAFCRRSLRGWILSIWDGEQVITIAQGEEIWAQWQSGSPVVCSSG